MKPIEPLEPRRLLASHAAHASRPAPPSHPTHPPPPIVQAHPASKKAHARLNPFYWDEINTPEEDVPPVPYAGTAGPPAPPLTGPATEAIDFDTDANTAGYYFIPPDNNVAAGPNHVVDIVNTTIEVWTKSGTLLKRQRLGYNGSTSSGSFFASLSPASPLFDPKVLYDQYSGRFVVVALDRTDTADGDPSNTSHVFLAVSATSDPTGTWYFGSINSRTTISGQQSWADYPGFGLDSQAIYVTANMFGFGSSGTFNGTRLWIVPKSTFYAGGAFTSAVYNPASSSGLGATNAFTLQPAHLYGTAPSGVGTFFVSSGYVSGSNDQLAVIRVSNPLSSPTFTNQMINLGDIDDTTDVFPGDVPQPGTSQTLDGGDERVMNAVWRNGFLYAVNTVAPPSGPDAGQVAAHWYKINTSNLSSLSLSDQGNVSAEDLAPGTSTFYPWVMVDAAGDMAVSFSAAGPNLLPGAYYTARAPSDAAGTVRASGTLAAGVDYYYRTFGAGRNRWGDYSGLALDPSDESTFWVFNQYAEARGSVLGGYPGEDGRWGTRFAPFTIGATVSGTVYADNNYSGGRDAGEPGVAGQGVYLDFNNNGSRDGSEPLTTTDANGAYSFTGLLSGSYVVRLSALTNYVASTAGSQTVVAPGTANFGLFPTLFTGSTPSTNQFSLRLDAAGARLEISQASAPLATPTYSAPVASLPALTFNTSGSGDALRLFLINGTALPAAGVTYSGSGASTLAVQGGAGADAISLTSSALTVGGRVVSYSGASSVPLTTNGGDDSITLTGSIPAAVSLAMGPGNDTLTLNSSALTVAADLSVSSPNLSINANSSTLTFQSTQHIGSLSLAGSSHAAITAGGSKLLVLGSLTIGAGSTLDLADNDLILDPAGSPDINPRLTQVRQWLQGGQLISSAAQGNSAHNTSLGYAAASQLGVTSFGSQAISPTALLIKYTYTGDANLDGKIDGDDFAIFDRGLAKGLGGWLNGDFNYDNAINASDRTLLDRSYGSQSVPL